MNDLALASENVFSVEQKQAAIEAILHSQTFSRADQLKSFLKFVCEMELAGRGHELTEYLIGVEALGRSPNYSPGDDSAVRNRAFALRKKLQEYYEHEHPPVPLRIELTKGSYCPHFLPHHSATQNTQTSEIKSNHDESFEQALSPLESKELAVALPIATPNKRPTYTAFFAGVLVTTICASLVYFFARPKEVNNPVPTLAPILSEVWGPLLAPNANLLMCVANPPTLAIHNQEGGYLNDPNVFRSSPELESWLKGKFRLSNDDGVVLSITTNGTYWGDSLGAMTVLKTITTAGHTAHLLPEKIMTMPSLRQRNVILFGAPEYSPAVSHFLEKCPLTVDFLHAIISRKNTESSPRYMIKRDSQFRATEVYGLITVLPSESSPGNKYRTVIFSGVNSAGTQAAAEYFSSPENLLDLKRRLKLEGYNHFPDAYQIVVKAEPDDNLLLSFKYETHCIIQSPSE